MSAFQALLRIVLPARCSLRTYSYRGVSCCIKQPCLFAAKNDNIVLRNCKAAFVGRHFAKSSAMFFRIDNFLKVVNSFSAVLYTVYLIAIIDIVALSLGFLSRPFRPCRVSYRLCFDGLHPSLAIIFHPFGA